MEQSTTNLSPESMGKIASNRSQRTLTPVPEARIQSIGRAKALLDAMADGGWVSLRDLATKTGLAKTTTFNLVSALVDVGLAERDGAAGAYRLSLQHIVYGKAVERRLDIAAVARLHLMRLCVTTSETVNLAIPGPTDAVIVESLEGNHSLRVTSYSGTRASYHSTACGRALFAYQPIEFRKAIYSLGPLLAATSRTETEPQSLEAVLARCRETGWTTEYEENEIGGACVAAPIFGPAGNVVAAVSIAGPSARFDPDTMTRLGKLLVSSLAEITEDLKRAAGPIPINSIGSSQ